MYWHTLSTDDGSFIQWLVDGHKTVATLRADGPFYIVKRIDGWFPSGKLDHEYGEWKLKRDNNLQQAQVFAEALAGYHGAVIGSPEEAAAYAQMAANLEAVA